MFVDIDKNFILGAHGLSPDIGLVERHEVECSPWQTVTAEGERLGIEKIAVDPFNPAGLAADVPRCTNVTGAIFESYCDPVPGFKLALLYIHGSPHLDSNSASLRSISSFVRIFFSIKIASMLAIQRS